MSGQQVGYTRVSSINLLGRYQFSTAELGSGQLRTLRDPTASEA